MLIVRPPVGLAATIEPRERQVLLRARDGAARKSIAAELGTTIGTVSVQLTRGLTKLGLQNRAQLLALGPLASNI